MWCLRSETGPVRCHIFCVKCRPTLLLSWLWYFLWLKFFFLERWPVRSQIWYHIPQNQVYWRFALLSIVPRNPAVHGISCLYDYVFPVPDTHHDIWLNQLLFFSWEVIRSVLGTWLCRLMVGFFQMSLVRSEETCKMVNFWTEVDRLWAPCGRLCCLLYIRPPVSSLWFCTYFSGSQTCLN